ncbi:MAG: homoserine kinase [Actinomycetota bacterium]
MRLKAAVSATVANLGPGFDCLGMALDLKNEITVDVDAEPSVEIEGEGEGELPRDASNLIFRAMSYLAREAGGSLPAFSLSCVNRIPLERGLGSSSSAVVAGLALADRMLGTNLSPDRLLEVAVDIEGHADNVAAALRGGLQLAYLSSDGWRAEALQLSPDLRPVVCVPLNERMPTQEARRVLPVQVAREDASFNSGRTALLVVALAGRTELLSEALEDRLHQPVRLPLVPSSRALFEDLREAGVPVCVAGAGPSLLAFESDDRKVPELGPGWEVLRVKPDPAGVKVHEG